MKFLIIGLGSMGQRRIRCLQYLKYFEIHGYDVDVTKLSTVKKRYKIKVEQNFNRVIEKKFDAIIISTDPKYHMKYAFIALKKKIPCFIEASVTNIRQLKKLIKENKTNKNLIFPSCTMIFNDAIMQIKKLVRKNKIGTIYFGKYHVGQYLPDWHPWQNIKDFYARNK